jgi:hypothetical protein
MRSCVRVLCLLLLPLTVACGGGDSSPTSPSTTTPPVATRVIGVSGNLAFGDVPVGSQRELSYTITNTGNATLTVTGTSVSGGLASLLTATWTNGTIAAGASQVVTVRFQPTTAGSYSGTVSVNGDQTSGTNTIAISANATAPAFAGTWSGRYVVQRCDGTGSNQDYFCSSRGAFPPGTDLPIQLSLSQTGSSVSGTISLGQVTGIVNGIVDGGGALTLQGSATGGQISLTLSSWSTTVSGTSMSGTFAYNAGLSGIPGVAVVVSRLSGVTRR